MLPQRRPRTGPSLRQQQRTGGVLSELGGKEGRRPQLADDERLHVIRVGHEQRGIGWAVGIRKPDDEAIVAPEHLDVRAGGVTNGCRGRDGPGRMHPTSSGRQHAHTPVAELVAHPLDHDGVGVGERAVGCDLIAEVLQQGFCRPFVEIVETGQPVDGFHRRQSHQVVHEAADGQPKLHRAPGPIASPERHLAGLTGGRRYQDAVVGNVLDSPGGGTQHEGFADAAFEDHFLVELANARRARRRANEVDAVQPPVGNGPPVGDRHPAGALPRADRPGDPVPGDPRSELGELVGGVAPRQHVQHAFERAATEVGKRSGPPNDREELVDVPAVEGRHGHDLLGQDVERIPGKTVRFHSAVVHRLGDRRGRDEIATVFGEDHAFADGVDLVTAAADPLEAAGHRRRRLDLNDEVDGAHVDTELERRGGDEGLQASRLQKLFDLEAL